MLDTCRVHWVLFCLFEYILATSNIITIRLFTCDSAVIVRRGVFVWGLSFLCVEVGWDGMGKGSGRSSGPIQCSVKMRLCETGKGVMG